MACLFCDIAAGNRPAKIVHRDEWVTIFHDIQPMAPTHALVIPNRHVQSLDHLAPEDRELAGRLLLACQHAARELGVAESGYRVVTNTGEEGGQAVAHLHFHVLGGRRLTWPPG